MDMGAEALNREDGVPKLVQIIEEAIHTNRADEAGKLFRIGGKKHGPLSRQAGETMSGYTNRRTRWWRRVQTLDSEMRIGESILTDYMLQAANISEDQQLMIKTVTNNSTNFKVATDALWAKYLRCTTADAA